MLKHEIEALPMLYCCQVPDSVFVICQRRVMFFYGRKRVFDVVILYYVKEQMRKNDVSFAMPLLLIYYEQYMNEIVY